MGTAFVRYNWSLLPNWTYFSVLATFFNLYQAAKKEKFFVISLNAAYQN